ncbi:MAG TPA: NAD(P)-binding domain-containing protein [Steroidobacteraceae bacterium]|nr:NAD(P)-binding domain-containing protein [Steroidobacteraceae bacterium]
MNGIVGSPRSVARSTDVVVIGAGHSGLAMSFSLSQRSIDHVVLERGVVANAWRHERWDSLRLLTPNWQTRLPGRTYGGTDPDGYMTMPELIEFLDGYAASVGAPVRAHTTVTSVTADGQGYRVMTDRGTWRCRAVVLANGAHGLPHVPRFADSLPPSVASLTPKQYRNPNQLDDRPVLVVGASATGVQIADEIQRSGRQVTLAVGEHIRMLRSWGGRDIQWWLDALGVLDERYDEVDDIVRVRRIPSPQLVGTPERSTLDLNALSDRGVELVGRLVGVVEGRAQFSGSLPNHCSMADLKLARLLDRIDDWSQQRGIDGELPGSRRPAPTRTPASPRVGLDFAKERIGTVIWATGFRPDYGWLDVPAFDRKGRLRHDGGVVCLPGLYVLGLNFMRRRKSSFIHGAEDDVRDLTAHLHQYLRGSPTVLRAAS